MLATWKRPVTRIWMIFQPTPAAPITPGSAGTTTNIPEAVCTNPPTGAWSLSPAVWWRLTGWPLPRSFCAVPCGPPAPPCGTSSGAAGSTTRRAPWRETSSCSIIPAARAWLTAASSRRSPPPRSTQWRATPPAATMSSSTTAGAWRRRNTPSATDASPGTAAWRWMAGTPRWGRLTMRMWRSSSSG